MAVLSSLLLLNMCTIGLAAFCKKEFFYHQHYSYGYDIYCNDLDNETLSELTHTVVYNEITLTIENSIFRNISWHIAKHLPKLREVNIFSCHLDNLSIFVGLKKLSLLNIQSSMLDKINYELLQDLGNLQQLILRNNSLENIVLKDFQNLDMLSVLNLNNNNLAGTFEASNCLFYNLKEIHLQYNRIEEIGNISCLNYVQEMYLDFNSIIELSNLHGLVNLKLLSLQNNKLKDLRTIQNLNKLELLNLEENKLSVLNENDLFNLNNLKYLNLKNNYIYLIPEIFFYNIPNLKSLNLCNNTLTNINLSYLPLIEELNLSNNKISSLKVFSESVNLKKIDVSYNDIREIDQYVFSKLTNITTLNLSHNFIENKIYDASFFGAVNLKELQMESIGMSYIPEDAFTFNSKLEILNLSGNKMQEFGKLFDGLVNLEVLNISYNKLEKLEYTTIKNMHNLKVIDIEGNLLKNIEYESILLYLHKLATINIKNNTLTCEFLSKMITFFNDNHVSYTINEEFNFDKENVAGIYCKENKAKLNESLRETSLVLEGNTILLKQLFNLTRNNTSQYNKTLIHSVMYAIISVILILLLLILGIYKTYVYLKRRHYCSDEFELIGRDKY